MQLRGIISVSAGSNTTVSDGFTAATIITPPPGDASGKLTTPSPYQTFSAAWSDIFTVGWTPPANAFKYNLDRINRLTPDRIDPSFRVLATASPVFPIPRNR